VLAAVNSSAASRIVRQPLARGRTRGRRSRSRCLAPEGERGDGPERARTCPSDRHRVRRRPCEGTGRRYARVLAVMQIPADVIQVPVIARVPIGAVRIAEDARSAGSGEPPASEGRAVRVTSRSYTSGRCCNA
jgi:hypothetical protein